MKWCEPIDFPTILEFLGGRYLDLQMVGTLISQNFKIYMLTWTPEKFLAPDLTQVDYIISKFLTGCHKYLYTTIHFYNIIAILNFMVLGYHVLCPVQVFYDKLTIQNYFEVS